MRRTTSVITLVSMMVFNLSVAYPSFAGAPAEDLKQIEFRYYFRGKYQQAIETLQTFLARVDVTEPERTRAREFLAASYVLGGAPVMGKEVFSQLIKSDPSYPGPDPTVFKLEVVNACAEARSEYTALTIRNVPAGDPSADAGEADPPLAAVREGKPIYKKWWFYAGAASLLLIAGAAASGDEEPAPAPAEGTVVVGVRVQ